MDWLHKRFRQSDPRSGRVDALDLALGVLLAIVIPLVTYVVIRSTGVVRTKSTRGQFRETTEIVVQPDAALIGIQIAYFEKIYSETGRTFLERAEATSGVERMRARDWAKQCFASLLVEISTRENEIEGDPGLRKRFAGELTRLAGLKTRILEDASRAEAIQ